MKRWLVIMAFLSVAWLPLIRNPWFLGSCNYPITSGATNGTLDFVGEGFASTAYMQSNYFRFLPDHNSAPVYTNASGTFIFVNGTWSDWVINPYITDDEDINNFCTNCVGNSPAGFYDVYYGTGAGIIESNVIVYVGTGFADTNYNALYYPSNSFLNTRYRVYTNAVGKFLYVRGTGGGNNYHWCLNGTIVNTTNTYDYVGGHSATAGTWTPPGYYAANLGAGTGGYVNVYSGIFPATLSISPTNISFGSVAIGQTSTQTFSVINAGAYALTGTATVSGTSFALVSGSPFNVSGGQTGQVKISFSPGSAASFTGSVAFTSNGGDSSNAIAGMGTSAALICTNCVGGVQPPALILNSDDPGYGNPGWANDAYTNSACIGIYNDTWSWITGYLRKQIGIAFTNNAFDVLITEFGDDGPIAITNVVISCDGTNFCGLYHLTYGLSDYPYIITNTYSLDLAFKPCPGATNNAGVYVVFESYGGGVEGGRVVDDRAYINGHAFVQDPTDGLGWGLAFDITPYWNTAPGSSNLFEAIDVFDGYRYLENYHIKFISGGVSTNFPVHSGVTATNSTTVPLTFYSQWLTEQQP